MGWKNQGGPIQHFDLIRDLVEETIAMGHKVQYRWLKGHKGGESQHQFPWIFNHQVDALRHRSVWVVNRLWQFRSRSDDVRQVQRHVWNACEVR